MQFNNPTTNSVIIIGSISHNMFSTFTFTIFGRGDKAVIEMRLSPTEDTMYSKIALDVFSDTDYSDCPNS